MFSVILLTLFLIHSCHFVKGVEIDNVMIFPIEQTSYVVYLDKKVRDSISATIRSDQVSIVGTQFWKQTRLSDFTKGEKTMVSIDGKSEDMVTKVGPVLPLHAGFCIRMTDTSDNRIRLQFNWKKDYLLSDTRRRPYNYLYEIKLYNFKGHFLEEFTVQKPTDINNPYEHTTTSAPLSDMQQYSSSSDPADILNIVIRVKAGSEVSPWTHHGVHPKDKFDAKIASKQQDWTIEEVIKQQSAYMMLTEWRKEDLAMMNVRWFTLFSQSAALSQDAFSENKYLSIISIPNDDMTINYNVKEIGQRSGAGFGLLSWSGNGHYLTKKFSEHFTSSGVINENLLKSLIDTCFSYGKILNAQAGTTQTSGQPTWRNAEGNNAWSYNIESQELKATRTMASDDVPTTGTVGQVQKVSWNFVSATWVTTPEGSLKE